ncbi:unnamed protein product [Paramecium sonneborni]|uniref:Transmembrane protein n=1 Tax=Paramecium sonneborni TaxID=65129 RepID=A0A8S1N3N1_9CILI|nr:unnamed protein product [Paramecium sonneborni]
MIKDLIKKVDLLVDPYEFNTSEKEKSLTLAGGIVSILMLIFTLFYIVEIVYRQNQNQNSIYAGTKSEEFSDLILSENNTMFALELNSDQGSIFNNKINLSNYFTINAQFIQQSRSQGIFGFTRKNSSMTQEKCSQETLKKFNYNPASITEEQKQNLICFQGDFELLGQYNDPQFQYIKLAVEICKNGTSQHCKTIQEIEDMIKQGINVNLFIRGSKIKKKFDPITPDEVSPVLVYSKLMTILGNHENVYLKPISLDIKRIQFFYDMFGVEETEQLFNGLIVEKQESRQEPISLSPSTSLCNFYLRVSPESSYFFVIQQDLITIILSAVSEGTALLFAAMQIIKFFYKFYSQHKTCEVLMNQIFKFDITSIQKRRIKKQTSKTFQHVTNPTIEDKEKQLEQILKPTINYSFFKYIKYLIQHCFKKFLDGQEDEELIISQIAKEKIEYDLDLSNILKKLYEIDCLKLFLFDDDQLMIFNAFSSPVFTDQIEEQKKNFLEIDEILRLGDPNQQGVAQPILNQQMANQLQSKMSASINSGLLNSKQIRQADFSNIPINTRLAKINWFFKSQLLVDAKNLNLNYEKIFKNENINKQANKQLLQFTKLNKSLYDLIRCNAKNFPQINVNPNRQITQNNQILEDIEDQNNDNNEQQRDDENDGKEISPSFKRDDS